MKDLEVSYRLLMRAYPPHYRNRHEDEIISTLLDVASNGQRRPRVREAGAMLIAGLGCRSRNSSELQLGVGLAGVVALAATFAVSTMAIWLAVSRPLSVGGVPTLTWLTVIGVSLYGGWSQSIYRLIPGAALTLLMVAAGSSAMGLRRSTIIPAAMVLLISSASRRASRSLRLVAPVTGVGFGLLFGALVTTRINHAFAESAWVDGAPWGVISAMVPWRLGSPLAFALFAMGSVLAGLWRVRFAAGRCRSFPTSCCTHAGPKDDAARARNCSEHFRSDDSPGLVAWVSWQGRHDTTVQG